jgi:hypothetical protein
VTGRHGLLLLVPACAISALACGPDVDYPTPPLAEETKAIVATYDMPTGTLDVARLDQIAEDVKVRVDELGVDWLPELMSDVLVRLRERFNAGGLPEDPSTFPGSDRAEIKAVVELSRVCSGWSDPPGTPNAAENGSIEMTAIVEKTQLDRELWGTASNCRQRLTRKNTVTSSEGLDLAVNAQLDGTWILYLGGPLPTRGQDAEYFMSFAGELGLRDRVRPLTFDFRLIDGQVQFRHPVDDGDIIVGVGLGSFSLTGQNATYQCDLAKLYCQP